MKFHNLAAIYEAVGIDINKKLPSQPPPQSARKMTNNDAACMICGRYVVKIIQVLFMDVNAEYSHPNLNTGMAKLTGHQLTIINRGKESIFKEVSPDLLRRN
jgi:hypothetical protein